MFESVELPVVSERLMATLEALGAGHLAVTESEIHVEPMPVELPEL